ncbi:MAG: four helix bundle protein [Candidatus Omnitrophota bacterium]
MRDFKKIKVYQKAEALILVIYKLTKDFPKEEIFGLTSQLRRAVVSVACNIAEGSSRQHLKDYMHFLYIARGSLAEVKCLVGVSSELGYVAKADHSQIEALLEEASKMLYGLIKSVKEEIGERL